MDPFDLLDPTDHDPSTSVYIAREGNGLVRQREKFARGPEHMMRFARDDPTGAVERERGVAELTMLARCARHASQVKQK